VSSRRFTIGVALALLLVVTALAVFAPWLATHHYAAQDLSAQYLPPATGGHLLGTDLQGRDLYSRTIYGARVSLLVAAAATIVSLLIGVTYGLVSGYVGGRTDSIMMRAVDVLYSLPFLFLVILIMTLFVGPRASPTTRVLILLLVLGAVQWLTMARIVRGQVLSEKTREYVQAAKALGVGHTRILFRHLLPNLTGIILTYAALTVPRVMLQEAFLSFLGLGVPEPYPSWGRLAADGVRAITPVASHWWLVVVPSLMITMTLFALNLLGDGLGEAGRRKRNTVGPA
jgi:oligopeptide transport system permease protein